MLTKKQKQNAVFARELNLSPDYSALPKPGQVWGREVYDGDERAESLAAQCQANYEDGQAVLAEYSLKFSGRVPAGAPIIDIPKENDGVLIVSSGHITTAEAERAAIFKRR